MLSFACFFSVPQKSRRRTAVSPYRNKANERLRLSGLFVRFYGSIKPSNSPIIGFYLMNSGSYSHRYRRDGKSLRRHNLPAIIDFVAVERVPPPFRRSGLSGYILLAFSTAAFSSSSVISLPGCFASSRNFLSFHWYSSKQPLYIICVRFHH